MPARHNRGVPTQLELVWTPTIAEVERAIRARRRATRVVWLERGFGAAGVVLFGADLLTGDWVALPFLVYFLLLAAGAWGFAYRWLFTWRRNPQLFTDEVRQILTDEGILGIQGSVTTNSSWDRWASLLHLRDAVMVVASNKGNTSFVLLQRGGAKDDAQWAVVLDLVEGHVPAHPRDPGRQIAIGRQPGAANG